MPQRKFFIPLIGALVALALVSCQEAGEAFQAPELGNVEVLVEGAKATFKGNISTSRADECGIVLLADGERYHPARLSGTQFEASVSGLQMDQTYSWQAYAKAGNSEIRSEVRTFTAPDGGIPIPDATFREYLLNEYDRDDDGVISRQEAAWITIIYLCSDNVVSAKGIEYMPSLTQLHLEGSGPRKGRLQTLDVSANPDLKSISCFHNQLKELDVSKNLMLEELLCWDNLFTDLDVTHNAEIREVACAQNFLTSLDLSGNPKLRNLSFNNTFITSIDLSANPSMALLECWEAPLTALDLSHSPLLEHLICYGIDVSSLDVSANPLLKDFDCSPNSKLDVLYVSKNQKIPGITEGRSEEFIPASTHIVEKSVE